MWQVATATGWTFRHIMWEVNYQTLIMAVSDQIRYKTKERTKDSHTPGEATAIVTAPGQDNSALEYFQSRANNS